MTIQNVHAGITFGGASKQALAQKRVLFNLAICGSRLNASLHFQAILNCSQRLPLFAFLHSQWVENNFRVCGGEKKTERYISGGMFLVEELANQRE